MKSVFLLAALASSSAFTPSAVSTVRVSTQQRASQGDNDDAVFPILSQDDPAQTTSRTSFATDISAPTTNAINGWTPDATKPLYGLPGAVAPTGYFDPLGFCQAGISLNDVKRYREAEVQHGRVAMIATVGYLAGEAVSGPFHITGPANDQLQQMPAVPFVLLTFAIANAEYKRATTGWVEPRLSSWTKSLWTLRDNYYPGDLGFDPLGLRPSDPKQFATMQTKELQNGRLAMLGVAGMCAQELVNHKTIFETFDFYQKVYSGINPYE